MGERLSALIFKTGLTVRELKEFIKDWPEIDSNGNPTEVWVEIGEGVSASLNVSFEISIISLSPHRALNKRASSLLSRTKKVPVFHQSEDCGGRRDEKINPNHFFISVSGRVRVFWQ